MDLTEASEHLVCAVLAAQAAALRQRIDTGATVELLWQTSDMLSRLSGLVAELAQRCPPADDGLNAQCDAAVAAEGEISRSLESLAFQQAQRNDFTCQTVDCLVSALERLADTSAPVGSRLSAGDLAELYVSNDQRDVHAAAIRRFATDAPSRRSGSGRREGFGK